MKYAIKLMALYERQVAAMDKRRGHAQQNVTVKHIHIAEGAQAIVGNVTTGGRRSKRTPKAPAALEEGNDVPMDPIVTDSRVAEPLLRGGMGKSRGEKSGGRRQ